MTERMTARERMRAALRGELPDRVPFAPTIYLDHACVACGRRFEDFLINPALGPRLMIEAAQRYQADHVRFFPGPGTAWFEQKIVREEDGQLVQHDRATGQREGICDVAGGGKLQLFDPPPPVRTLADARALPVPSADEYEQRGHLRDIVPAIAEAHRRNLFVVGCAHAQTINFMVQKMGGTEPALLCFYDDPELALALINKAVATSLAVARSFLRHGVDAVMIGDSYASGSVISPAIYQRFCAPAYREVAQEVQRHGVLCYKHCCGNYMPLLELVPDCGVDGMDGLDPTSGMSVAHTKAVLGDRLTLMGGISCLTLWHGTPEQVTEEARQCLAAGKPGGRYVLGSACAVARFTPADNLLAASQAAREWGRYEPAAVR